jgi:hypothetical protein
MFFTKIFGIYTIRFDPPPSLQGHVNSFDTIEEVNNYIRNTTGVFGDAWIILKLDGRNYRLHECRPIPYT